MLRRGALMDDSGRVAIVTGAARGIGYAISERFALDGYHVAMLDLNYAMVLESAQRLRDAGGEAAGFRCDVSDIGDIDDAVKAVAEKYGGVDVLVNNAAIMFSTPIEEVTGEEWDKVLAVNLRGMFFTVQKALPYLKASSYPRIINISSMAGRTGGHNTGISYTASKGGVIAMTKGLARQLAQFNITVNTVCPGTVESEIFSEWSDEKKNSLLLRNPFGRLGQPREIASAVCYLASEETGYITGTTMDVNGGSFIG